MRWLQLAYDVLKSHLRLGYVSGLLAFDCLLFSIVIADIILFARSGRKAFDAVVVAFISLPESTTSIRSVIFVPLFCLVILPITVAVPRVVLGPPPLFLRIFCHRNLAISAGHALSVIAFTCLVRIELSMQSLAGLQLRGDVMEFSFTPIFLLLYTNGSFAIAFVVFVLILPLVQSVANRGVATGQGPPWLSQYIAQVRLADLHGDLYPSAGKHGLNFNSAAICPEINLVRREARRQVNKYQAKLPGSDASRDFVAALADETRSLVRTSLFAESQPSVLIEFYFSTARCIEVALLRCTGITYIIVSPFEHMTEVKVAEWVSSATECQLIDLSKGGKVAIGEVDDAIKRFRGDLAACLRLGDGRGTELSTENATDQRAEVVDESRLSSSQLPGTEDYSKDTIVFIVSEAYYATGEVIAVQEMRRIVGEVFESAAIITLVDGAHSAGHLGVIPSQLAWDFYVVSAHKWLCSAEPCGILMTRNSDSRSSYDGWDDGIPCTTASIRMIAGVFAGLRAVSVHGRSSMRRRAKRVRDEFFRMIGDKYRVNHKDGYQSDSLIVNISPAEKYEWVFRDSDGCRRFFDDHKASVAILEDESGVIKLRLSFQHFLDTSDVVKMVGILNKCIKNQSLWGEYHE